jgi:predicted  nucleic acid-binding Zn-ribbon protein
MNYSFQNHSVSSLHIIELTEAAKKLELCFISLQNEFYWENEGEVQDEIDELQNSLEKKDQLITKFKSKIQNWSQNFERLKNDPSSI